MSSGSYEVTGTDTRGNSVAWWVDEQLEVCSQYSIPVLQDIVRAPGFIGPGEDETNGLIPQRSVEYAPFNESGFEKSRWYEYKASSIPYDDRNGIPFNSTVWLDGKAFELDSPFLDVGLNCSGDGIWSSLGNCICYKGKPIDSGLLDTDRAICNIAPGFSWGFSTNIIRLGFILEAIWIFCFMVARVCLHTRSELLHRRHIKTAGNVRLALEFAYSIFEDLGFNAAEHLEEELLKKLKGKKVVYRTNPSTVMVQGSNRLPLEPYGSEPVRLRSVEQVGTVMYKHRDLGVYS